ncbi:MAG: amino acid permease, partial [Thermoanaerobaculia bacterium]|nr:amino acid permease [Thermoanaerobaculia bacterium]
MNGDKGESTSLDRVLGIPGAVLMGLGSILGTGIFVSIGVAAGIAGPAVVLAVALAAVVATFNGLSSAQLAANHPVSGGTYEYGYRYLNPSLGFTAGWMFLCAKSASAATAALGFAGYLLTALGHTEMTLRIAVALGIVALLTAVVAGGMRRSNRANAVIVSLTLLGLLAFILAGTPKSFETGTEPFSPFFGGRDGALSTLLHATALMFVAST